jgi:hypothetical protein
MSHHQIPRLDGDQAERCDGNLPFASRLVALMSMTVHWTRQAFVEGEIAFSGGSSNGGFWSRANSSKSESEGILLEAEC